MPCTTSLCLSIYLWSSSGPLFRLEWYFGQQCRCDLLIHPIIGHLQPPDSQTSTYTVPIQINNDDFSSLLPSQAVNFSLVPPVARTVFLGGISLAFTIFLCNLRQQSDNKPEQTGENSNDCDIWKGLFKGILLWKPLTAKTIEQDNGHISVYQPAWVIVQL